VPVTFTLDLMKSTVAFQSVMGKAAALALAGGGALAVSALAAMYVVMLCGRAVSGWIALALFAFVALAALAALSTVLKRLIWSGRAALGVLLLAGSFLLLPRPTCAAEPSSQVGC